MLTTETRIEFSKCQNKKLQFLSDKPYNILVLTMPDLFQKNNWKRENSVRIFPIVGCHQLLNGFFIRVGCQSMRFKIGQG